MKTIRRFLYREILAAVGFVTIGFLALFFFFDFVDELRYIGKSGVLEYRLVHALAFVTLSLPNHFYELLPIAVLIGTIFVMARLAQSSEFTIMRTSGLGPWRALKTLLILGLGFVVLTFAVGDYVAPASEKAAQFIKSRAQGRLSTGLTGAWLKEQQDYSSFAVNVRQLDSDGTMHQLRIVEMDNKGHIVSTTQAASARFGVDDAWNLSGVVRNDFPVASQAPQAGGAPLRVDTRRLESLRWPTRISAEMVAASLLRPERMRALDLFQYIRHLDANGQSAQRYEIEFWRKVFYPLSCLVMVVLALPFAYLHFRSGGIATYVFGGVLAGISFFLLNNVFGYIGNLQSWRPWLAASAPGIIYSVLSLGAFGWLVLRR